MMQTFKINPPLRKADDVKALKEALCIRGY